MDAFTTDVTLPFALVIILYLIGIAIGFLIGKRWEQY